MNQPLWKQQNPNNNPLRFEEKYTIQGLLDKGSEGVVYSIYHKETKQTSACKKIELLTTGTVALRALQEIRVLKSLSHENIIKLEEVYLEQSATSFAVLLVYEMYPSNLSDCIKNGKITAVTQMKFIISQTASALCYLHNRGIIHRDIKPSNILVGDRLCVKLCDFGSCKLLTQTGNYPTLQSVSTKIYMPPEGMNEGIEETTAIDIWQLGCVFLQMLLRSPPFKGHSLSSIKKNILSLLKPEEDKNVKERVEKIEKVFSLDIPELLSKENKGIPYFIRTLKIDTMSQELIFLMLQVSPKKRITAQQILQHQSIRMFKQRMGEDVNRHVNAVQGNENFESIITLIHEEEVVV
ncbi:extracellular signal-regulated kinase, putative [Entamoeba invadens IP1]|uniref:extracellular signal-regulated kinase, putative n=1 Tax=Entamoeba invadens IP1 TaxID=370355 RepID=UPI0002C3DCA9|nr:extracellular signal-regulated kinase, putative [Entamoeba invadens IP1]ELP93810.1 extracellular signal-regulated kinase, putative [Entamoeba invadens IP1]|eukprot:XP_004260581.1 extracellular signal-regulated kinase, putative [Entamoeba invadens IP1]